MSDLLHEWVTIGVDWEAWRRMDSVGIGWEDLNRCGGPLPVRVRVDGSYFERPRGLNPAARLVCRLAVGELARLGCFPKGQEHTLVGPQGVDRLAKFVEIAR